MVTAKIDVDNDDPYLLAKVLMSIPNYRCAIRLSSKKGAHLRIYGMGEAPAYSLKSRLDDPFRVQLDESRERKGIACTNVLWDTKNGDSASAWIEWSVKALGFWLLRDTSRSLRDAITNLYNVVLSTEFQDVMLGVIDYSV